MPQSDDKDADPYPNVFRTEPDTRPIHPLVDAVCGPEVSDAQKRAVTQSASVAVVRNRKTGQTWPLLSPNGGLEHGRAAEGKPEPTAQV